MHFHVENMDSRHKLDCDLSFVCCQHWQNNLNKTIKSQLVQAYSQKYGNILIKGFVHPKMNVVS